MEDFISRLIEADKKAREQLGQAKDEVKHSQQDLKKAKEELEQQRMAQLDRQLEKMGQEEESKRSAASAAILEKFHAQMGRMQQIYREKHVDWEDELFKRCVER